ncbi:acyltransferase [Bizionia argentinensis JUB59]|uniref:Acyltransferase n=1 Tax=Bizionia argentinensis JUB59 TaxID=1046627 RepID=G2EHP8_9FLAO|nr:1-acyl-sn-glycerol-3-phosphate acyltransferase [Bizionia argentinensis]EGV42026.1 acyltransferase [Bizionia argentinensis JUB59]
MRRIAEFIYFKMLGWRVTGNVNFSKDTVKKAVLIGVPHTSWHDLYIGVLLRNVSQLKSNFIAKKELFIGPIGWYLKAIGGAPIDRGENQNKVEAIAQLFAEHDEFRLALAPEGTRKKVTEWRTGFYYIAKAANVPIIMFSLDFKNKQNNISEPFYPTDDLEADFAFMKAFFKGIEGKVASYS